MKKRRINATLKSTKARAIKLFNQGIRRRDTPCKCCTCGRVISYEDSDAGHFISCAYESTRFDLQNVHAQCRSCNRFKHGKQFEHGQFIDKKYGSGTAERLLIKSKMYCKRTIYDYEYIINELKTN